jgi:hypothetical protein
MTADRLSHALETRPSEQHLEQVGLMKNRRGSLSDVLHSTAVQLEKSMIADNVNQIISKRASDLEQTGAPPHKRSSLSDVLAANAKELERNMTADNVSQGLSRRSSQQELLDRGVLHGNRGSLSDVLAANAKELEVS